MKKAILMILVLLAFYRCGLSKEAAIFPYRWFYSAIDLKDENQLRQFRDIAQTAGRHRLNGVVLYVGPDAPDFNSSEYLSRLQRLKSICQEARLEIIPMLFSVGYGSVFSFNKNLAEGIPVKGALFQVRNKKAFFLPDSRPEIENGQFEYYRGNHLDGFQLQDNPGKTSFVDTEVHHDGQASLRLDYSGGSRSGMGRMMQTVNIKPKSCYRLTCWVKNAKLIPQNGFYIQVCGDDNRVINTAQPRLTPSDGWQKITFGFNSLHYKRVKLYWGVWQGISGQLWIDGMSLEPVALTNILRRPGTPVTVRNAQTGVVYEEGRDYAPLVDSAPNFSFNHDGPAIEILQKSRIHDGDFLSVDYYHGINVTSGQVTLCMSEPEVYRLWEKQAAFIDRELHPNKYFLSMDEIRAGGTCQACRSRNMSLARILGDCVTRQVGIIRKMNPQAEIAIWSDMLDPHMNARNNYYLADGDFSGSWNYIPKDLVMVCWSHSIRNESLRHFSGLGFKTMGAVYYDSDVSNIKDWINSLNATPGRMGMIYTTWLGKYDLLSAFGDLAAPNGTGQ